MTLHSTSSNRVLEQFGVTREDENMLLQRLLSAYRKHLDHPDTNTQVMLGRRGGAVRRVEDNAFASLEALGIPKQRDRNGDRPLDQAYNALTRLACHIVFVTGDDKQPPKALGAA